jgi:small-conductance mechanosensitive channel
MNAASCLLSRRKKAKSLLYHDKVTWLVFTLLSLLAINFFAELVDREADLSNFMAVAAALVMYPLFSIGIGTFGFSYFLADLALHPLFILLAFAYLYVLSCLPSYLLRWIKEQDRRPGSGQA